MFSVKDLYQIIIFLWQNTSIIFTKVSECQNLMVPASDGLLAHSRKATDAFGS